MMSSIESASIVSSGLVPDPGRSARGPTAPGNMGAYTAVVLARIRDLAPYAALELVLPGGSLMALLLWLYRRHKRDLALPK